MVKVITCKDIHAGDEVEFYLQDAVRFQVLEREDVTLAECGPCVELTLRRVDGKGVPNFRIIHRETTRVLLVHRYVSRKERTDAYYRVADLLRDVRKETSPFGGRIDTGLFAELRDALDSYLQCMA